MSPLSLSFFEFRPSLRLLRREPLFSLAFVSTVALCLAANVVIFTVLRAVLLKPLPYRDPERLVITRNLYPRMGALEIENSLANYEEFRARIPAFASVGLCRPWGSAIFGEDGACTRLRVQEALPSFFTVLGVEPFLGRCFSEGECLQGQDRVVLLSHSFWLAQFNGSPGVIGRSLRLDGVAVTVIGVIPAGFDYLSSQAQVYRPLVTDPADRLGSQRHNRLQFDLVARLAAGSTLVQAQEQLDRFNEGLLGDDPFSAMVRNTGFRTVVRGLHDGHVGKVRGSLLLLQAGSMLLLLIGSVNLANLLLVRASGRAREHAVREALGAGVFRLTASELRHVVILCVLGGLLGFALGAWLVGCLPLVGADRLPLAGRISLDWTVGLACLGASVLLGVLLGLVARPRMRGSCLAERLAAGGRGMSTGKTAMRFRFLLVSLQVALVFVLFACTCMLAIGFRQVLRQDPGFRSSELLVSHYSLPVHDYAGDSVQLAYAERLLAGARRIPGGSHAGLGSCIPLSGDLNTDSLSMEAYEPPAGAPPPNHYLSFVAGDYFQALGIGLVEGRYLGDEDLRSGTRCCVIDEEVARRYWPGRSPLGLHLWRGRKAGAQDAGFLIVGVVRSVRQQDLAEPKGRGMVYLPFRADWAPRSSYVLLRTPLTAASAFPLLREAFQAADPGVPMDESRSMEQRVQDSLGVRRTPALLSVVFALLALLLALVGVYGVMAGLVAQRRRELGIRMALGASGARILVQVLLFSGRVLLAGGILGLGVLGLVMLLSDRLLAGVSLEWLVPSLASAIVVAWAVFFASLLPALRASRIDPLKALREG